MSGGSFNYLCYAAGDAEMIAKQIADLKEMVDMLARLAPESPAHIDTLALYSALQVASFHSSGLAEVWRAVEWWQSCDSSREQAMEAIDAYNQEHTDAKSLT